MTSVGITLRSIRVRKHWRQEDLAAKAGVWRSMIARIEHGRLDTVPLGMIRRVAAAIDARFDTTVRWQGGDLGRLVSGRHAAMHEVMAQVFANHRDWVAEPGVSFSIYGERGIIDILAWHPTRRILLVVELKTEFVDIVAVGTWVVLPDNRTNRRARRARVGLASQVSRGRTPSPKLAPQADRDARRAWFPALCHSNERSS